MSTVNERLDVELLENGDVVITLGGEYRCVLGDGAFLALPTRGKDTPVLSLEGKKVSLTMERSSAGLYKITEFPIAITGESLGPFGEGWYYRVTPDKKRYNWEATQDMGAGNSALPRVRSDGTVTKGDEQPNKSGSELSEAKAHSAAWGAVGAQPKTDGKSLLLQVHRYIERGKAVGDDATQLLAEMCEFLTAAVPAPLEGFSYSTPPPPRMLPSPKPVWQLAPSELEKFDGEKEDFFPEWEWASTREFSFEVVSRVLPGEYGNFTKMVSRPLSVVIDGSNNMVRVCRWQLSHQQWVLGLAEGTTGLLITKDWAAPNDGDVPPLVRVRREMIREVPLHPDAFVASSPEECAEVLQKLVEEFNDVLSCASLEEVAQQLTRVND
jgi:hypothetical protein